MIRLIACGKTLEAMEVERELDTSHVNASVEALFNADSTKKNKKKQNKKKTADGSASSPDASDSEDDGDSVAFRKRARPASTFEGEDPVRANMTKNSNSYFRHLFQKFIQAIPAMQCENCRASKLQVKNDQGVKLFQLRPARVRLNEMWAAGIRYPDVTAVPDANRDDVDDRMTRWLWELDEQRLTLEEEEIRKKDGDDSEPSSDADSDVMDLDDVPSKSKKAKAKEAEDGSDEEEGDGSSKKKQKNAKKEKDTPKKRKNKKELEQEDAAEIARKTSRAPAAPALFRSILTLRFLYRGPQSEIYGS